MYRRRVEIVTRIVLTVIMLAQVFAAPFVYAAESNSIADLRQTPHEPLNAYLERVAYAQPELFQNAAMAAVQDAFNGVYGEDAPEDALEQRVAFYVNGAIEQTLSDPFGIEAARAAALPAFAAPTTGDSVQWAAPNSAPFVEGEGEMSLAARPADLDETFAPWPDEVTEPAIVEAIVAEPVVVDMVEEVVAVAEVVSADLPQAPILPNLYTATAPQTTFPEPDAAVDFRAPTFFAPQPMAVTVNAATKDVGKLRIEATTINETANTFEATGEITLTVNVSDVYTNHVTITGANAKVEQDADGKITGTGTVRVRPTGVVTWTNVFTGDFGISDTQFVTTSLKPKGDPVPTTINKIGDYKLVGFADISSLELQNGGASIAAQLDPASVGLNDSIQKINVVLQPDGTFSAPTTDFMFKLVGLTVTAKNITFTEKDGIKSSEVEIELPAALGGGKVTLKTLQITTKAITIDGGNVKFKLPDITFGGTSRDVDAAQAANSSLKITDIEATIELEGGKYKMSLEGQLELKLPSNDQKIKVSFEIDPTGAFKGTIDKISLTIAGNTLKMKAVEITNTGLTAESAEIIINSITSSNGQKLTGTVKKVAISGAGITIGEIGAKIPLPEIKLGSSVRFYQLVATLGVESDGSAFNMAITGKLDVTLPANESQTIDITATMDKAGKFSGELGELSVKIIQSTLKLTTVKFDANSLSAATAELTLPTILAGKTVGVTNVSIDKDGVKMSDATIEIGDVTIGGPLKLKEAKVTIARKGDTFSTKVEGQVVLDGVSVASGATGELTLTSQGSLTGQLKGLSLTLAGLTIEVQEADYANDVISAKKVLLKIPDSWGGAGAEVNNLRITNSGVSISGGKFELPKIKIGDIEMELKGELEKITNGYRIKAEGFFKMPNTGAGGCAGIRVGVTIALTSTNDVVMVLTPLAGDVDAAPLTPDEARAVQGFSLENISVALEDCYIPVGTTGFGITKVSGSFTLTENVTKIEIGITISTKVQIAGKRAVDVIGNAKFEQVKDPRKSELSITGAVEIFSMFKAAEAGVNLDFVNNKFTAELQIRAVVFEGGIEFSAWERNGEFYLTGRGYLRVGIPKAAVMSAKCLPYPWWTWSRGWHTRQKCTPDIPNSTYWLARILVEAGRFSNDAWGAKAKVSVLGFTVGAYVDSNGNFATRNVDQYRLATAREAVAAYGLQQRIARGELSRSALSAEQIALIEGFSFAPGQTTVNFNVEHATSTTIGFVHPASGEVGLSLIAPNGLIITQQNIPGHVSFVTAVYTDPDLPENDIIETVITVEDAYTGEWKLQIEAESSADDPFSVQVVGTDPGPQINELQLAESGENQVDVVYNIETAAVTTTVSIYATTGPVSSTIPVTDTQTFTDARGVAQTRTVTENLPAPIYDGIFVGEFTINRAARSRAVGRETLDLSNLESGDYFFWVTADDGENNPTRQYIAGATTQYGQAYVQHPWTPTWTATVTPTIEHHGIDLVWEASTNPDVDEYEVVVSRTENTPKEGDTVVPTGASTFASLTGLLPNQQYYVTIVGVDSDTGRVMDSQTLPLKTIDAPFTMESSTNNVTVVSGGDPVTMTLTLNSNVTPYPEGIYFFANDDSLENAFLLDYTFGAEFVTPTSAGVQTTLTIQAPAEAFAESNGQLIVEAFGAGGFVEVPINVTVVEPSFTLQTDQPVVVTENGVTTVQISASYSDGEQNDIQLDIDAPAGLIAELSDATLSVGETTTLTLTDSTNLPLGVYDEYIDIIGWDGENERVTRIPVSVQKPSFEVRVDPRETPLLYPTTNWRSSFRVEIELYGWTETIEYTIGAGVPFVSTPGEGMIHGNNGNLNYSRTLDTFTMDGTHESVVQGSVFRMPITLSSGGVTKVIYGNLFIDAFIPSSEAHVHYFDNPDQNSIVAGEQYTTSVAVYRQGYYDPGDVTLFETLPAEHVTLVDAPDYCTDNVTELVCELGEIGRTDEVVSQFVWEVAADAPEQFRVNHSAEITTTAQVDVNPANDFATLALEVVRDSDLAVTLESTPAIAGAAMVYTATVVNNGPSVADGVTLSVLPFDATVVNVDSGCTQEEGADVLCDIGTLQVGEDASVSITATVPPFARGIVEADALALSDSFDPSDEVNELALLKTSVGTDVTLDAVIDFTDGPLNEGELITYTVTITNAGPSEANDIVVQYAPPAELVLGGDALVEYVTAGEVTANYKFYDLESDIFIGFLEPNEIARVTLPMFVRDDTNASRSNVVSSVFAVGATEYPTATAEVDATLNNVAPTIEIVGGNTLTMSEGLSKTLQAVTHDVRRDVLTTVWDLDNDGQYDDATGNVVTFGAANRDGDSTQIVNVKVTDDEGAQSTATTTIMIMNAAPMVEAGANRQQQVNQTFSVSAPFVELSPSDTHTAKIDWGDGTIDDGLVARDGNVSGSHLYSALGDYNVNVCVTDSDGAMGCDEMTARLSCVEHGTTIKIDSVEAIDGARTQVRITFTVNNGSGLYTMPAGTQMTLYAGDTALHTTALTTALAVGQSETFTYDWTDGATGIYDLTARFNDGGDGTPTDALLCALDDAGKSKIVGTRKMSLPLSQDPIGADDSYEGAANVPMVVSAEKGLLANDSDPDGDSLTAILLTQPTNGTILLQPNGAFRYMPSNGGTNRASSREVVTFNYAVSDGYTQDVRTVTLNLATADNSNAETATAGRAITLTTTTPAQVTVQIPANAVSQSVTPTLALSDQPISTVPAPTDATLTHILAPKLQAYLDGAAIDAFAFELPVTLTIDYSSLDLSQVDETTIVPYLWNGSQWVEAGSTCSPAQAYTLDTAANTVTVQVCQTAQFSLQAVGNVTSIAAKDADKLEGDSGFTAYTFEVMRTISDQPETFDYVVTSDSADADDFAQPFRDASLPSGSITLGTGEVTQTLTIFVAGDTTVEADETFTVTLTLQQDVRTIAAEPVVASGTIRNDDASFSIAAKDADKAEGDSGVTAFTFEVTRTGADQAATFDYVVTSDSADGDDFALAGRTTFLPSGNVSFGVGVLTETITVGVVGDTTVEADETFTVTLSLTTNERAETIAIASASGTIRNDDASFSIAAKDADKPEGDSDSTPFTFEVTRAGADQAATLYYAVTSDAADADDFAAGVVCRSQSRCRSQGTGDSAAGTRNSLPTGAIFFTTGEVTQTITIDVAGDTTVEADEAFTVTLSLATPVRAETIANASASGTIRNDDASFSIAAKDADKPEGDSGFTAFTFEVTRMGADQAATLDYVVTSDSADGDDFAQPLRDASLPSGSITLGAGEVTQTLTIFVAGDTTVEADETFTVTLSLPTPPARAETIETATASGVIRNDDDLAPTVVSTDPVADAVDVSVTATITISFSEAVSVVDANQIDLICDDSAQTFTHALSDPQTLVLTPTVPLPAGERCDVTLAAASIADLDGIDPAQMASDYTFSFTTAVADSPASGALQVSAFTYQADPSDNSPSGNLDGFIVIKNVGTGPISLDGYKLGDEETRGGDEGMFLLPNVELAAGAQIVVAEDADNWPFSGTPDYSFAANSAGVPTLTSYTAWSSGVVDLDDSEDEVILLDGSDQFIDGACYGQVAGEECLVDTTASGNVERAQTRILDDGRLQDSPAFAGFARNSDTDTHQQSDWNTKATAVTLTTQQAVTGRIFWSILFLSAGFLTLTLSVIRNRRRFGKK